MKTVELIEEETPWFRSGGVYLVKIGYDVRARGAEGPLRSFARAGAPGPTGLPRP